MQLNKEDKRNGMHTKKIEMHIHTSEGSFCGKVSVYDVVRMHSEAGYDAMVLTNHFNRNTVPKTGLSDKEAINYYVDIYRRAEEYGQQFGIDAEQLRKYNIPTEMHIFPYGGHGLGLTNKETEDEKHISVWGDLLVNWFRYIGWLGK